MAAGTVGIVVVGVHLAAGLLAAVAWSVAAVALALRLRNRRDEPPRDDAGLATAVVTVVRRTIWLQVGLLAVVLLVVGGLVLQRPSGASSALEVVVPLADDLDALVAVDPVVDDRATIHLYLLDPTGRPTRRAEALELAVRAGGSGDAVRVQPLPAGPGHWIANVVAVAEPGTWQLELVAHLDDGETARAHVTPDAR